MLKYYMATFFFWSYVAHSISTLNRQLAAAGRWRAVVRGGGGRHGPRRCASDPQCAYASRGTIRLLPGGRFFAQGGGPAGRV